MNVPKELMYTKSHEWVKTVDETTVVVGLTDYAQDALGRPGVCKPSRAGR